MINITKSQPPPSCLAEEKAKKNGKYDCDDVLDRISQDFHNKCYICEAKDITKIEIEHFEPHQNKNIDLKFDWNNLFFACGHCNGIKGNYEKYHPLLNCTDSDHQILEKIRFEYEIEPKGLPKITALFDDELTNKTVALLNDVYFGRTKHQRKQADNLRKTIEKEMKDFLFLLFEYFDDADYSTEDLERIAARIRQKLSVKAPFTAFKICYINRKQDYINHFAKYLPQ